MTSTMISSLTAQGWRFTSEVYNDGHKNDDYMVYFAQSPRVKETFSLEDAPEDVTLNKLLELERAAYAEQLMSDLLNEEAVNRAVAKALKSHSKGRKTLTVSITLKL